MKRFYVVALLALCAHLTTVAQNRFWIATTPANWNNTANWSATSGGAAGASVPGAGNVAVFDGVGGRNGVCNLDIAPTVGGITVNGYSGTIDLKGNSLTTTGTNVLATGSVANTGAAGANLVFNTTLTTTFSGTAFSANITGTSGRILFNGSVFNGTVALTKTANTNDDGTGNNTFAAATVITNSSTAELRFASTTRDIFNSLALNINNTGGISLARVAAGNQFNGNITINYNSTGAVLVGAAGGTSTLANTRTITVAGFGASGAGNLSLTRLTQTGTTAQTIVLGGNDNAILTLGPLSTFCGNLTVTSPSIIFNSSTFGGVSQFTKTGSATDNSRGGNIFNGVLTINNQGGDLVFGSNTADPGDTWNAVSTFNNSGGNRIRVAEQSAGSVFNANATFNCLGGGADVADRIQISRLAGGEATFNGTTTFNNNGAVSDMQISYDPGTSTTFNGPVFFNVATSGASDNYIGNDGTVNFTNNLTITNTTTNVIYASAGAGAITFGNGILSIGGAGFSAGQLQLRNFTQTGNGAQNLTLTGNAVLRVGPSNSFNGNVTFIAPQVYLESTTYNGTAYIEKNGPGGNTSPGGNTFAGTTTIVNSGSSSIVMAQSSPDIFNGNVTVTNTGSALISMANNSAGNAFNGNIVVNNTGSALGIYFSVSGAASSTLASGKTISVGPSGFDTGELRLEAFTQSGPTPQVLTGTGTALFRLGPGNTFNGDVNFIAPQILLQGTTYNGTAYIEKNGATNSVGAGGNIFNSTTTLVNSGSGQLITANSSPDTFASTLTLTNSGSSGIFMAHNVAGTVFGGNIILNSTGSSSGIYFSNTTNGTSTLNTGASLQVGVSGFSAGELRLQRMTQVGPAAQTLTLTNGTIMRVGPSSSFDGNVTFIAPQLYLNGAVFGGTTILEKNGAGDNNGNGGNVFNGTTTITVSGSGYLLSANTTADTFNGNVTFTNTGSNVIYMAHNVPGTTFNGNIIVNSTGSSDGFYLSNNATGSATLSNGGSITTGASGFSSGELRLQRFTQIGATPQTLTLTNGAMLRLGNTASFGGNVHFVAPQLLVSNTLFSGTTYLEKTGANDNTGTGGSTFNGPTTLVNSGSGSFEFGNTLSETFNSSLVINNTGTYRVQIGIGSAGNLFNGDVTINHGGNSPNVNTIIARNAGSSATFNGTLRLTNTNASITSGIVIGNDGNATINGNIIVSSTAGRGVLFGATAGAVTMASGFTVADAGPGTFTTGTLTLNKFTQLGTTPQNITLTANADMTLGPTSSFGGAVTFITPQIILNGTTFNSTAYIEKTGAIANIGAGSNIFSGVTTLVNSGSGAFISGNASRDIFLDDLTLNNTGSSYISMADNSVNNLFQGNILVTSPSGLGIYFGNGASAAATLAAGKTITAGVFTNGELRLKRFTQMGATPQTIALTGTAALDIGPTSTFNGNVDFRAAQLYLDGCTYNGTAYLEKRGATNNTGLGGNTFNSNATIVNSATSTGVLRTNGNNSFAGPTLIQNSSSADLLLELLNPSTYIGDVTFTNTGSSNVRVAYIGSNVFLGNIIVNSSNGTGVAFCENAAGLASLANGKTISVGTGFTIGTLTLQRFTQVGGTAQTLLLTSTGILRVGPTAIFNGSVDFRSPQLFLDGCFYNGATAYFEKTGAGSNDHSGANVFSGTTTIVNSGTARSRMATVNTDTYNGAVTFIKTGTGALEPAYNFPNVFGGDITVNSPTVITFGAGNGTAQFNSASAQTISKAPATTSPVFQRIQLNKSANAVTLATDITVGIDASFVSGNLNTTATNVLTFVDNATATGANNSSYVDGPVRKTGNDIFVFPTGNGGFYRPISISAPTTATHQFTAQYFKTPQTFGNASTFDPTFWTVSGCEYWILDRTIGTSNVNVTLSWNENACGGPGYVTQPANLRVARWNGTKWVSHGNGGITGNSSAGTIVSSGAVTAFSPFTLASTTPTNPLPIELKKIWAEDNGSTVSVNWITASELNNKEFTLQRSANGLDFEDRYTIEGRGTTSEETNYFYNDESPLDGLSYYRLKQTDFDGTVSYPGIVSVRRKEGTSRFQVYPNPAGNEVVHFTQKANIVIVNSLDQTVGTAEGVDQIDVSALPAGIYIIRNQKGEIARLVKK